MYNQDYLDLELMDKDIKVMIINTIKQIMLITNTFTGNLHRKLYL